ncbi:MAG: hypothetical protein HC836_24300 [Richelia sp. RM2_1_2]|nr:hypothetical protein [Richelia sp. RM2_1_2]
MLKIGLNCLGFNCEEHLENVLHPWIILKQEKYPITISAVEGIFSETASLGYNFDDQTRKILTNKHKSGWIDHLSLNRGPAKEHELRNIGLWPLLDDKVDYVWLLDLQDEVYTKENILNIIKFIENSKFIDFFHINMKNYVFDYDTYYEGFCPPRIWNNNAHNGIKCFYYDNNIEWCDGKKDINATNIKISKSIAFVDHYSWVGSDQYLKRKVNFQMQHYGHCSYKFNEKLEFNDDYYKKNGESLPELIKVNKN